MTTKAFIIAFSILASSFAMPVVSVASEIGKKPQVKDSLADAKQQVRYSPMTAGEEHVYLERLKERNRYLEEKLREKESKLENVRKELDARTKEVERREITLKETIETKRQIEEEQLSRMAATCKALKTQDAATLINKLDTDIAIRVIDKFDKRTLKKIIPLLKPELAVIWAKSNLPAPQEKR